MNEDVKQKWLDALRSGKYQQTKGYLNVVDDEAVDKPVGYCCLGVLCEIAVEEGVIDPPELTGYGTRYYDGEDTHLPISVQIWSGLTRQDGLNANGRSIVVWNDGDPYATEADIEKDDRKRARSFAEIANLIEEYA